MFKFYQSLQGGHSPRHDFNALFWIANYEAKTIKRNDSQPPPTIRFCDPRENFRRAQTPWFAAAEWSAGWLTDWLRSKERERERVGARGDRRFSSASVLAAFHALLRRASERASARPDGGRRDGESETQGHGRTDADGDGWTELPMGFFPSSFQSIPLAETTGRTNARTDGLG